MKPRVEAGNAGEPRLGRRCGLAIAGLLSATANAALAAALAPLAGAAGPAGAPGPGAATPQPPWVFAGLPGQTLPATRFTLERQDGATILRVQAAASYGNLVHALDGLPAGRLVWRWRVDRALAAADLRRREGDDVALKVCALFDLPRAAVPFVERQLLRLAEARTGEALPGATLCYAWDPAWPEGTVVPNAYSRRVRYITLGQGQGLRSWQRVERDLAQDFLRAFGEETTTVPRLMAIGVGADADNTGGESLGAVADLQLQPGPAR